MTSTDGMPAAAALRVTSAAPSALPPDHANITGFHFLERFDPTT
jgi:hypothetical protein